MPENPCYYGTTPRYINALLMHYKHASKQQDCHLDRDDV